MQWPEGGVNATKLKEKCQLNSCVLQTHGELDASDKEAEKHFR